MHRKNEGVRKSCRHRKNKLEEYKC